jgi:hypothetical protein
MSVPIIIAFVDAEELDSGVDVEPRALPQYRDTYS